MARFDRLEDRLESLTDKVIDKVKDGNRPKDLPLNEFFSKAPSILSTVAY